jgi:hypothetical protein
MQYLAGPLVPDIDMMMGQAHLVGDCEGQMLHIRLHLRFYMCGFLILSLCGIVFFHMCRTHYTNCGKQHMQCLN